MDLVTWLLLAAWWCVDCHRQTKEQPWASQILPRVAEGKGPEVGLLEKKIRESRDRSLRVRGWSGEGDSGDESESLRRWSSRADE